MRIWEELLLTVVRLNTVRWSRNPGRGFPNHAVEHEASCCWTEVRYNRKLKELSVTNTCDREMQLFLIGYIIISICEIFTIGWFPLSGTVRVAFTAIHIASIVATLWILLMNAVVGYQILDDGTIASIGLIFGSAAALFVGTGYIALDTGFAFTDYWQDTVTDPNNRAYALYTLYQLVPLIFLVAFFILEAILVLRILGEVRPMCKCHIAFASSIAHET